MKRPATTRPGRDAGRRLFLLAATLSLAIPIGSLAKEPAPSPAPAPAPAPTRVRGPAARSPKPRFTFALPGLGHPKRLPLDLQQLEPATSSAAARDQVIASLPLDQLEDHHRAQVENLVSRPMLFRRLPAIRMEIDPHSYEFFRQHPDVAVAVWRVLGISRITLDRNGPGDFAVKATDGSTGRIEILLRTPRLLMARGTGTWTNRLLPGPIRGEGLMLIRHRIERDKQGRLFITHQAALMLSFPQQSVHTMARLISPITNMVTDRNFQDISVFLRMMHLAAVNQPGWVEMVSSRLDKIDPARRMMLLKATARAHVAERRRLRREAAGGPKPPGRAGTPKSVQR